MSSKLTLIGETHNFDHLEKAPLALKNCDGSECELKYLGGLRIGVKFIDDKSRDTFLLRWSEWFRSMESGDIATYNFERIAWLKITGLPPKLWSEENFSKIARTMGRVIVPFEVDTSSTNLVYRKVGVITESLSSISTELTVEIKGKVIKSEPMKSILTGLHFRRLINHWRILPRQMKTKTKWMTWWDRTMKTMYRIPFQHSLKRRSLKRARLEKRMERK